MLHIPRDYDKLRVKLKSDFVDYYCHWADRDGYEFIRMAHGGPSRPEQFNILAGAGIELPPYGRVEKWYADPAALLVVYLDEMAHRGEGKRLVQAGEAIKDHPGCLATRWIGEPGQSYRCLRIGYREYWLSYHSETDWRSNAGDVEVKLLLEPLYAIPRLHYPLYAIDFVTDGDKMYAVDLNVAPGLSGTGIEEVLPARLAMQSIKEWLHENGLVFFPDEVVS